MLLVHFQPKFKVLLSVLKLSFAEKSNYQVRQTY